MICINNIFEHFKWWQFFLSLAEQPRANLFMTTEFKKSYVAKTLLLKKWIGQFSSKLVPCKMATWKLYTLPWHRNREQKLYCLDIWCPDRRSKTFLLRSFINKLKKQATNMVFVNWSSIKWIIDHVRYSAIMNKPI